MKKIISAILVSVMMLSLCACSEKKTAGEPAAESAPEAAPAAAAAQEKYDIDLTAISGTMVYAEVYDMYESPENYVGKTVKMSGTFQIYEGLERNYYACLISDALACCSQGVEFVLTDDYSFPEDYPEQGAEITVTGVFDTYYEDDYLYCQLVDARFV